MREAPGVIDPAGPSRYARGFPPEQDRPYAAEAARPEPFTRPRTAMGRKHRLSGHEHHDPGEPTGRRRQAPPATHPSCVAPVAEAGRRTRAQATPHMSTQLVPAD